MTCLKAFMSRTRYTDEFKIDAVRQVTDKAASSQRADTQFNLQTRQWMKDFENAYSRRYET